MKQIHNSEALPFWKIAGFWGFTNSASTPETETSTDLIKLHSCTKPDTAKLTPEYTFM